MAETNDQFARRLEWIGRESQALREIGVDIDPYLPRVYERNRLRSALLAKGLLAAPPKFGETARDRAEKSIVQGKKLKGGSSEAELLTRAKNISIPSNRQSKLHAPHKKMDLWFSLNIDPHLQNLQNLKNARQRKKPTILLHHFPVKQRHVHDARQLLGSQQRKTNLNKVQQLRTIPS